VDGGYPAVLDIARRSHEPRVRPRWIIQQAQDLTMAITRANTSLDIRTCFVAFLSSRETYEHVTVLHLVGVIHSLPVGSW